MKRQVVALVALASAMCGAADGLLDGFRAPPRTSRPETWMQVSGGNASKEGMTLDLEAVTNYQFS